MLIFMNWIIIISVHELAVTERILEIALKYARAADAVRVTDVNIVVGRLSGIVDESVQFYWDLLSRDTLCRGSQLHFKRVAAQMQCLDCQHTYLLEDELTPCPQCNSVRLKTLAGEEFYLDSIEIENSAAQ